MQLSEYKSHLQEVLLPFWIRALDHEYGGVFTCYTNKGDKLTTKNKYTWSQGRFLWLWARIAERIDQGVLDGDSTPYLDHLLKSARFLEEHVFLDNGRCAYLLDQSGIKLESIPGKGYDTSIFADCFVAIGLAETARVSQDPERMNRAIRLYRSIRKQLSDGDIRTEPYPVPKGFYAHSIPMILLNVAQTLADGAKVLDLPDCESIQADAASYMEEIMNRFRREDGRMVEMVSDDPTLQRTLLGRHFNPGHALESMWFVIMTARACSREDIIADALQVIETAIELGWDNRHGGLFRFTDCEGGEPSGKSGDGPLEQLILETWDTKLWWPHSEALYTTLLASVLSDNPRFKKWHEQIRAYTFSTFPNPDRNIGEWIQIRNRRGKPLSKVVALPVKDPFHIMRNILLIIDLLEKKSNNRNQPTIL